MEVILGPDIAEKITSYRYDLIKIEHLERLLETLKIGIPQDDNYKEMTVGMLLDQAKLLWVGDRFYFYFKIQNFLTDWVASCGVGWSLEIRQTKTQEIVFYLLRWLEAGIFDGRN